jgi:uncharacterized repeat protein (TIGR01451 family)
MRLRFTIFTVALSLAALAPAPAAHATFPGSNGKIAFVRGGDIWTMNPDGSNQVNVTNDAATQDNPSWSADGNLIVFDQLTGSYRKTWWMLADGSNRHLADNGDPYITTRVEPAWSPDATEIVFDNGVAAFRMRPDGTFTSGPIWSGGVSDPDWSADGQFLSIESSQGKFCDSRRDLVILRVDGTGYSNVTNYPCSSTDFTVSGNSFSPDAQRVAYYQYDQCIELPPPCPKPEEGLWTANLDGSGKQQVSTTVGATPAYSPDGTKFAFGDFSGTIKTMNTDGTGVSTPLATGSSPDWQPIPPAPGSVDVLAALSDSPDPVKGGGELHYTASAKNLVNPATATGVTLTLNLPSGFFFVSATPTQGSCSHGSGVVTCNFGTLPQGASASVDVLVEAPNVTAPTTVSASAHVSADQPDPVVGNNTDSESTQVTFGAYPRPKSATPTLVPLVIAYKVCGPGEATEVHASPLNYPSCANPQQTSGFLTAGTPDANGNPANFIGQVKLHAINEPLPLNPNNGDQSDVGLDASLTDVRNKSDLSPYNGGLLVNIPLQITDHDSGAGGFTSATVVPTDVSFAVPCSSGTCSLSSTYEAVVPGAVKELKRANWELGAVRVLDGGADGNPATGPNTVFAVQGVFVP